MKIHFDKISLCCAHFNLKKLGWLTAKPFDEHGHWCSIHLENAGKMPYCWHSYKIRSDVARNLCTQINSFVFCTKTESVKYLVPAIYQSVDKLFSMMHFNQFDWIVNICSRGMPLLSFKQCSIFMQFNLYKSNGQQQTFLGIAHVQHDRRPL